jgi:hypothetical protein
MRPFRLQELMRRTLGLHRSHHLRRRRDSWEQGATSISGDSGASRPPRPSQAAHYLVAASHAPALVRMQMRSSRVVDLEEEMQDGDGDVWDVKGNKAGDARAARTRSHGGMRKVVVWGRRSKIRWGRFVYGWLGKRIACGRIGESYGAAPGGCDFPCLRLIRSIFHI